MRDPILSRRRRLLQSSEEAATEEFVFISAEDVAECGKKAIFFIL